MKITIFLFNFIFLINLTSFSQKHDFKWLMGYSFADNPYDTGWGCAIMDFDTPDGNPIFYEEKYKLIDFGRSGTNICDPYGKYLFSCNGGYVEGPNDSLMENGDDLGHDIRYPELGTSGSQNVLILPFPGNEGTYVLFNKQDNYIDNYGLASDKLEYNIIDMQANRGNGKVISRRNVLLKDTLDDACLTATKHANGRDWWIVISEDTKSAYYIFLLSPEGVQLTDHQNFGIIKSRGEAGQSFFSNNGQYFCTATNDGLLHRYNLFFMKFDRCEGKFSLFKSLQLNYQILDWDAGCAFSNNNKYLYYATLDTIYQFPIVNDSLGSKKIVAFYDGYIEDLGRNFTFQTEFGPMLFAPDGRIYNQMGAFPTRLLHVINDPDQDYEDCDYQQHAVACPTIKQCLPNFPNYRLGPIDGSDCDSLGIDNIPWCHWRYNQDSSDYLHFRFTDLSAYEVEEWHWDFGDPLHTQNTSRERHPRHTFSGPGVYTVCLIVKNKNGADTLCRIVRIGVVDQNNPQKSKISIQHWPNPVVNHMVVNILDYNPKNMYLRISDISGQIVFQQKVLQGSHWIRTDQWAPGLYQMQVFEKNENWYSAKIVKL